LKTGTDQSADVKNSNLTLKHTIKQSKHEYYSQGRMRDRREYQTNISHLEVSPIITAMKNPTENILQKGNHKQGR